MIIDENKVVKPDRLMGIVEESDNRCNEEKDTIQYIPKFLVSPNSSAVAFTSLELSRDLEKRTSKEGHSQVIVSNGNSTLEVVPLEMTRKLRYSKQDRAYLAEIDIPIWNPLSFDGDGNIYELTATRTPHRLRYEARNNRHTRGSIGVVVEGSLSTPPIRQKSWRINFQTREVKESDETILGEDPSLTKLKGLRSQMEKNAVKKTSYCEELGTYSLISKHSLTGFLHDTSTDKMISEERYLFLDRSAEDSRTYGRTITDLIRIADNCPDRFKLYCIQTFDSNPEYGAAVVGGGSFRRGTQVYSIDTQKEQVNMISSREDEGARAPRKVLSVSESGRILLGD